MSYLFDLYRGEELDPTFFEFAMYMVFFPVTISGPICRMPDMLPQFRSTETTPWASIEHGFRRIATGIFMVQLAKLLGHGILAGGGVNAGFDPSTHWSGLDVWCLALGYGLQLFLDFAGYSHIAIGVAQALGFTVPENFAARFNPPAFPFSGRAGTCRCRSGFATMFFFPLAMLRREMWWRNLALVIAMVLFGLWHQATVAFPAVGLLSRSASGSASSSAAGPTTVQLGASRRPVDAALLDRDHGLHQPGMGLLPLQFSRPGRDRCC